MTRRRSVAPHHATPPPTNIIPIHAALVAPFGSTAVSGATKAPMPIIVRPMTIFRLPLRSCCAFCPLVGCCPNVEVVAINMNPITIAMALMKTLQSLEQETRQSQESRSEEHTSELQSQSN